MASEIERVILEEWRKVRASYGYPALAVPQIVDEENAFVESGQIYVGRSFADKFVCEKIGLNDVINEILTHEVGHFMYYPGSALNVLRMQKIAMEYVEREKVEGLCRFFVELQTNIYQVNVHEHPYTIAMREKLLPATHLQQMIEYGIYKKVWHGASFRSKVPFKHRGLVRDLSKLNYTTKETELIYFREFVQLLKDVDLDEDKKNQEDEEDEGEGSYPFDLGMFSDKEISDALKAFSKEVSDVEFEDVVGALGVDLAGIEWDGDEVVIDFVQGLLAGGVREELSDGDTNYRELAKRYSVMVQPYIQTNGEGLVPSEQSPFVLSDPLLEINPFSTPGIMPGITKKWERQAHAHFQSRQGVPNALIVIDNSGSMPSPAGDSFSVPVLCGHAIANAYLMQGSSVGAYTFGGEDKVLNFTRQGEDVSRVSSLYTNSGCTYFNPKYVEQMVRSNVSCDVVMISDFFIGNFADFVGTVSSMPMTHRVHLLRYHPERDVVDQMVGKLRDSFSGLQNVYVNGLNRREDISGIVVGDIVSSIQDR